MSVEVQLTPSAIGYVGVELGGREVGVTEHLLHAPQIRAAFEQMRGERVAEEVRVDAFGLEAGLLGQAPEDEEGASACQRAALRVQEQLWAVSPIEVRTAAGEVAPHRFDSLAPDRDEPFLAALAEHAYQTLLEVDRAPLEADRLRDSQAAAVQQLHERAVAKRAR
jgi:hypothetical protein